MASGNISQPALFLGDSKYDHQAARAAGLDFVFVSGWSEVIDWSSWVAEQGICSVDSILSLQSQGVGMQVNGQSPYSF